MREAKLPVGQPEYKFHPTRKWKFDYAHVEKKIAVEIEGGIWSKGRHIRPSGFIADCQKYNAAAAMGWLVFRIPTDLIANGEAIELMQEVLA